jgi:hypothetical protein
VREHDVLKRFCVVIHGVERSSLSVGSKTGMRDGAYRIYARLPTVTVAHDDSVEFGMEIRINCVTYSFSNSVLQREGTGTRAALRMGARGRGVRQVGISWVGICRCHC